MQLFNVLQGRTDVGELWNQYFDRVLSKIKIYRSMMDLEVHARIIDEELMMVNVSTDDILV